MNFIKVFVFGLFSCSLCAAVYQDANPKDSATRYPLRLVIKNREGKALPGVQVNIAATEADMKQDKFIAQKRTSPDGKAELGNFAPGLYYYKFDVFDGIPLHAEDTITVLAGKTDWREIQVESNIAK